MAGSVFIINIGFWRWILVIAEIKINTFLFQSKGNRKREIYLPVLKEQHIIFEVITR